jgi:hypothetical protein
VKGEKYLLLIFETAPFFCIYPVYEFQFASYLDNKTSVHSIDQDIQTAVEREAANSSTDRRRQNVIYGSIPQSLQANCPKM